MDRYFYLSLIPESLVVSMLAPPRFGTYLSTGTKKRAQEQAVYFELDGDFVSDYFGLEQAKQDCVPHEDGEPKHTVYVSIYRVLEHIPLDKIGSLWLTTRDGRTLELKQQSPPKEFGGKYHLYQELCPVHPLIASVLNPLDLTKFITDPSTRIGLPRICFAELSLGGMADDARSNDVENLPYKAIGHLRDCISELASQSKTTKTVNRIQPEHIPFRCIKSGFFIGGREKVLYYPMPSSEELKREHHAWWRSAALT